MAFFAGTFFVFYTLWKKSGLVDFSFISFKKHHSTLEMNTFKGMLLHSIINLAHVFKSPFLDIEITRYS